MCRRSHEKIKSEDYSYHILFHICIVWVLFTPTLDLYCQQSQLSNHKNLLLSLRDSLNSIQYTSPSLPKLKKKKVISIRNQEQWDSLNVILESALNKGKRNIEISVEGKDLILPLKAKSIMNLNYPDANVRIVCKNAQMVSEGVSFSQNNAVVLKNDSFWVMPYNDFNIDDVIDDGKGNEITLRSDMKILSGQIKESKEFGDDVWKMETDLPDLNEDECKYFYILLTRDWNSVRHKVVKVKKGQLFFHLDTDDWHSSCNPNVDYIQYKVYPRYCFINCPVSEDLHIKDGKIYIPIKYTEVKINKGGYLIHMLGCRFNSFEVVGFNLNFLGNKSPISVYKSSFVTGLFIHDNTFHNLSSLAIRTGWCNNVVVYNNSISNTRTQAIECGGHNTTIAHNRLKRIGWMQNTPAITGNGDKLHICDNIIEDFGYSAISCGNRSATRDSVILNYIVERNIIRYTEEFRKNYKTTTLADGGGIYVGPSCTQGVIRNNVIIGMKGIHSNRGIFLDDGAKNLAIYGNLIMNTDNSYDIDLRFCQTFKSDIPDHNSNNCIFNNILTGSYRFEDAGNKSSCFGGQNLLLNIGRFSNNNKIHLGKKIEDIVLDGSRIQNEKIIIPRKQAKVLDDMKIDAFVLNYVISK